MSNDADVLIIGGGVIGSAIAYTAIVSWILLKLVDIIVGLRVEEDDEAQGLDLALHEEKGYDL